MVGSGPENRDTSLSGVTEFDSLALLQKIMPYANKEAQKEYQRKWVAARRNNWMQENGPCVMCGSWIGLQLDHKDPKKKVDHKVWSWSRQRREKELKKCQALCRKCHRKKTNKQNYYGILVHGTIYRGYNQGCKCRECLNAVRDYKRFRRSVAQRSRASAS